MRQWCYPLVRHKRENTRSNSYLGIIFFCENVTTKAKEERDNPPPLPKRSGLPSLREALFSFNAR